MDFFCNILILLKILILNVIIVCATGELNHDTKMQASITIDRLNRLIKAYPAFIKLKLQKQDYYTGKDVSRCPMPYNKDTILDDPDVVEYYMFNPRECMKPWAWTRKNEVDVPVSIDGTIGKKLGEIIQPCLKENTNIIQCYTHYLNVIESVGLTLVDRFCLFTIEVINRLRALIYNKDYIKIYTLFNIKINTQVLNVIFKNFKELLTNINLTFRCYYISTLPLECVLNTLQKMGLYLNEAQYKGEEIKKQISICRELMKSKKNYAVLDSDQYWKWDIISDYKPDDNLLILTQYENNEIGLNIFALNEN